MEESREKLNKYILIFLFGGFLGWIIEFIYRSAVNQKIVNPGFLSGPCLPIYGFGLILLMMIIGQKKLHWLTKIFIFTTLATLMELVSGWFFEYFFHLRLWNYSAEWGNWHGWICPRFTFFWFVTALLFYLLFYSFTKRKIDQVSTSRPQLILAYIFIFLVFADMTHAFYNAEKIGFKRALYGRKFLPTLSDYKIFTPNHTTDFINSTIQSLKNYSNYDLPNKIFRR